MSDDEPDSGGLMGFVRTAVPDVIRRSFALKFFIVLLVMGLVIFAIGAFATSKVTAETREDVQSEYSGLARQEANLIGQWTTRNELTTRLTSASTTWTASDPGDLKVSLIQKLDNSLPVDATDMHIFNRTLTGDYMVASTAVSTGTTVADSGRKWVLEHNYTNAATVRQSSVYENSDGEMVVGYASRIPATENRYLLVEFAVSGIARSLQGAERTDRGFTQVVNDEGTVLIDEKMAGSSGTGDVLQSYGDKQARKPLRNALKLSTTGSGVISKMDANSQVMNEQYAVGYAQVDVPGHHNWVVLVHAPTSEVFGFVQTVSQWGLIATALAVLLIGLIGAVLGYNTSTSIDRLSSKAEAMEEGDLDVDIESKRIDNIGRLYEAFGNMRDALKEQIREAEQARKEAEVSRAEAMEMNNYLQEKAEQYSEIMQAGARGDLTRRMEPEGENEAMDQIARDFNDMVEELEMTTGQLKTFAVEVEEGGQSLQQSAETVRDASEQVADSVQKISDDAYDAKERLQDISEEMDAVADQLEQFQDEHPDVEFDDSLDRITEIATMIEEAADLSEETMAESENVAGAAEEQAAELNEVSARAEELTRYAQYLGDGLNNFDTEEEHEFVFQTGAGGPGAGTQDADEE